MSSFRHLLYDICKFQFGSSDIMIYSQGSNNRSAAITFFGILHRAAALIKCDAINISGVLHHAVIISIGNSHRSAFFYKKKSAIYPIFSPGVPSYGFTNRQFNENVNIWFIFCLNPLTRVL